jgi:hypothetical protein
MRILTNKVAMLREQVPGSVMPLPDCSPFTSAFAGQTAAFPGIAAYAASKAGLIGLTQALAMEFSPTRQDFGVSRD